MGRLLDFDRHGLGPVTPIRPPARVNLNHPSLYDRTLEPVRDDDDIVLDRKTVQAIVTLLGEARPHLSWRRAVGDVLDVLGEKLDGRT